MQHRIKLATILATVICYCTAQIWTPPPFYRTLVKPSSCPDTFPPGVDAMLWDEDDCALKDWRSPITMASGESKSWGYFSTYADNTESLCVRSGCTLAAFDDGRFSDDQFNFVAPENSNLCLTLDKPPKVIYGWLSRWHIRGLDNDIRSVYLQCGK